MSTHVGDFNLARSEDFITMVTSEVGKMLDISKSEDSTFRFTGIDIKKVKVDIELSMEIMLYVWKILRLEKINRRKYLREKK